ncbi:Uncharacterized protein SCF082_LOCUS4606, partial [Durusdinium trenchii]
VAEQKKSEAALLELPKPSATAPPIPKAGAPSGKSKPKAKAKAKVKSGAKPKGKAAAKAKAGSLRLKWPGTKAQEPIHARGHIIYVCPQSSNYRLRKSGERNDKAFSWKAVDPHAGIAEVLQAVAETGKVPTAASKSTVKRRRDAAVDLETPYGKLLCHFDLPLEDGQVVSLPTAILYVLHTEHNSDNFTLSTDQSVWAIVDHLQHQAALPGLSKKKFADEEVHVTVTNTCFRSTTWQCIWLCSFNDMERFGHVLSTKDATRF